MHSNNASVVFGIPVSISSSWSKTSFVGCLIVDLSPMPLDVGLSPYPTSLAVTKESRHTIGIATAAHLLVLGSGVNWTFPVLPPAPPHALCFIDWLPDSEAYIEPYPRIAPGLGTRQL